MITQQRRNDDPGDPWFESRRSGGGAGTLLLATMLGVGIGLLAAPQPGTKTRKLLLKRLAELGEEVGEGFEEVQDLSSKARKRARQRLSKLRDEAGEGLEDRWREAKQKFRREDEEEDEEDEESSGSMGTILALAAGVAATYLLTSERAEPVRSRVQHAASDVRRRASDEWDRFQRGGTRGGREDSPEGRPETRTGSTPSDEAPQAN
jgi:gas vesicle protein